MEKNQKTNTINSIDPQLAGKLIPQMIPIPIGLFHLNYGGKWGCIFVSDKCPEILGCTQVDFLERLESLPVLALSDMPEKTVGMLLEKMQRTQESCVFVSVITKEDGELRYIRGTLAVSLSADGRLRVYGQITDVTGMIEVE